MKSKMMMWAAVAVLAACNRDAPQAPTDVSGPEFAKPGATGYSVTSLGALGAGGSEGHAVNGLDHAVGNICGCGREARAFYWSAVGGMDSLPMLTGYNLGDAWGINDQDLVAGVARCVNYTNGSQCSLPEKAVIWQRDGAAWSVRQLPAADSHVWAHGINNAGRVIGRQNAAGIGYQYQPVVWTVQGTAISQESLPNLAGSTGLPGWIDMRMGINNTDQAVGTAATSAGYVAVLWFKDGSGTWQVMALGGLPSGTNSTAIDVADPDGLGRLRVAGTGVASDGKTHAVRWTLTPQAGGRWAVFSMEDMGLGGGGVGAEGRGVNTAGDMAGYVGSRAGPKAALWSASGTMISLPSPGGGGGNGVANAITDIGVIVGRSYDPNAKTEVAVLWRKL